MNNLIDLSNYLAKIGLQEESKSILKLAQTNPELESWQEVLNAVQEPIPDQVVSAARYVAQSATEMYENAQKLNQLSEDDLKLLVEIAAKTPTQSAANFQNLNKTAQMGLIKSLGPKALRLMPVIGFIFSFLLALKNFIYGLTTFAKLAKDASQIGLSWFDILFPEKLNEKVIQYQNDPEKLKTLVQLTKYSREFSDEGISLIANTIDFIKDIIFLFLDFGSFGWLTVGDISLSFIIMGIEYLVESNTLSEFEPVLTKIVSIANKKIQELSAEFDPNFFKSDSDEVGLYNWFAEA